MSWKTMQKTDLFLFIFCSPDDAYQSVPFTSSEPVDNWQPTQEGKQTSQEYASTSKRPRSNQAPWVKKSWLPWRHLYWAIQAGLLTPLTFARHCLSPLAAFTSSAYFLHNGRRWQWICEFYTANVKGIFWGPQNTFFLWTHDLLVSHKMMQRQFIFTLHPLSAVIFAIATVLSFVLLRNSSFNFHCYTQREATPTQKSARKYAATSRDFFAERLQSSFTLANQLRWIAQ